MSDNSLLNNTKAVLRAILISSPDQISVHQLNRDYKNQEGRDIPFSLLGYASLKACLSNMNDVLIINPHTSIITPIASKNSGTAHIHKLVSEQRAPARKNRRQQRQDQRHAPPPPMFGTSLYNQGYLNYPVHRPHYLYHHSNPRAFEPGNLLAPPHSFMNNYFGQNMMMGIPHWNGNISTQRTNGCGQSKQKKETVKQKPTSSQSVEKTDERIPDQIANSRDENPNTTQIDAIPPMDDDDPILFIGSSIPENGRTIPPAVLPKDIKAGETYPICVTEVSTRWHFFFQFNETLNDMSNLETEFDLCWPEQKMKNCDVIRGNVCAAFIDSKWMRAEILTKPDEHHHIKLLLVDFGTIEYVSKENVRYLQPELCVMPRLCHRGVLDFLEPIKHENERKVIDTFCDMVRDKSLMALISSIDENDNILSMTLVDTSHEDEDMIINKILIDTYS